MDRADALAQILSAPLVAIVDRAETLALIPLHSLVAVVHRAYCLALFELALPAEVVLASCALGIGTPALALLGAMIRSGAGGGAGGAFCLCFFLVVMSTFRSLVAFEKN